MFIKDQTDKDSNPNLGILIIRIHWKDIKGMAKGEIIRILGKIDLS